MTQSVTQTFPDGTTTYVIARKNGNIVLGGTRENHDFYSEERLSTTERILRTAPQVCPELGEVEIEYVGVGFRPARLGGIRCEVWPMVVHGRSVVEAHNYGHDSYGYQTSWGTAKELFRQLEHHFIQAKL
jgi:glycine/D-amino acid oxidase-like deaminating enzyme